MQYDVFISHASQDKDVVVRPLAKALKDLGLQVWLDEEQLHIGDSIRRGVDAGLRESRFGLVVLSPAYLNSEWGQKELDAFFTKEKNNTKSILPIYHGISVEEVETHTLMLADKISLSTTESIGQLAQKIQKSIQSSNVNSVPPVITSKKKSWWPSHNQLFNKVKAIVVKDGNFGLVGIILIVIALLPFFSWVWKLLTPESYSYNISPTTTGYKRGIEISDIKVNLNSNDPDLNKNCTRTLSPGINELIVTCPKNGTLTYTIGSKYCVTLPYLAEHGTPSNPILECKKNDI